MNPLKTDTNQLNRFRHVIFDEILHRDVAMRKFIYAQIEKSTSRHKQVLRAPPDQISLVQSLCHLCEFQMKFVGCVLVNKVKYGSICTMHLRILSSSSLCLIHMFQFPYKTLRANVNEKFANREKKKLKLIFNS